MSFICLIHRLSVGVVLRPQPCLVQWRLEEFITHHYIWWAVLTVLQRWQIMREAANKTNITHPLLPFSLCSPFFTLHTPILYSQSLNMWYLTWWCHKVTHICGVKFMSPWEMLRICELRIIALKTWMRSSNTCAYYWEEKVEIDKVMYTKRNRKRASSTMTPQPPFLSSALSNLIIQTHAKAT